jgi:hypothetical protein
MQRRFLPFDLVVAAAGLVIALILPLLIEIGTNTQETALVALSVVVFQGITFWTMRRNQARTIQVVRRMLLDRVRNQLQVIMASLPSSADKEQMAMVLEAVQNISDTLAVLSPESVREWVNRYPDLSGKL